MHPEARRCVITRDVAIWNFHDSIRIAILWSRYNDSRLLTINIHLEDKMITNKKCFIYHIFTGGVGQGPGAQ